VIRVGSFSWQRTCCPLGGRIPSMKALRMISVLSVLPLMVVVDVWTWLEDGLARLGARRW
jgi:hypothetical protein